MVGFAKQLLTLGLANERPEVARSSIDQTAQSAAPPALTFPGGTAKLQETLVMSDGTDGTLATPGNPMLIMLSPWQEWME